MMDAMARVTGDALTLCSVCNRRHTNLALLLGASAPDDWLAVSTGERLEAELTPDVCILPDAGLIRHYIRGHLQLPVDDPTFSPFVWSVWVEVDEESMRTIAQHWSDPNRAAIRPLEGELANELPYAEPTKGLAVEVHTRDMGQAPLIMLARGSEHALAVEQRNGITVHRVAELGELLQR